MKYLNTKPLSIFTLFYKALLFSFLFCGIFSSQNSSASYASNLCLHPLEEAALLYGNQGEDIEGLIKRKETEIEKITDNIEDDLQEKIDDEIVRLSNSLDDTNTTLTKTRNKLAETDTETIAKLISNYMEEKQDELDNTMFSDITNYGTDDKHKFAWHNRKYFKKRGQIKDKFCKDFAKDIKDCNRALDRLARRWEQIHTLYETRDAREDELEELRDKAFDIELGDESTEANGVCFECLDAIRELNRPSPGQTAGSILSLVAGGAMSYYAYKAGKRSVNRSNLIRAQQGFAPLSSAGPAWAGASLGLPFISHGIHGLSQANSQIGNVNCSGGSFSQNHAHAYNPYAMGPGGAHVAAHIGGNPFPFAGANAQLNFNSPFNHHLAAGANAQLNFNSPFYNPLAAGANAQLNFNSPFNHFAAGANAQLNFNSPFYNPLAAGANAQFPYGGGAGGFQAQLALQQQQQQQQQYTAYLQFQQQQMEARIQAQQAWQQQQQALQQDRMHRQQVITSLSQEMNKIQQQIQMVAAGGTISSFAGATASTTLASNTTFTGGATAPLEQQPITTNTGSTSNSNDAPIFESR